MRRAILCTAVLLLFIYGVPGNSSAAALADVFGLAVGNTWTYQGIGTDGPYITQDKVINTVSYLSRKVYVVEKWENGVKTETQWLERTPGKIKLWGGTADFGGPAYTMNFSTGLLQAWYPMRTGESRFTATTLTIKELPDTVFNASMRVDVIGKKQVLLSFGRVTAYKIRCRMRVWGNGADETASFVQWNVPYLGCAKYEDPQSVDKLVSFSINGGSITQKTDRATFKDKIKEPAPSGEQSVHNPQSSRPITLASKTSQ